jgi:hypothetical protein
MPRLSIFFGGLLIIQGIVFWGIAGFETARFTAAIPAFFGIIIVFFGLVAAAVPNMRKHVMHISMLIALLGICGGIVMSVGGLKSANPMATKIADQMLLALLCLIYLIFGVKSFLDARANRSSEAS